MPRKSPNQPARAPGSSSIRSARSSIAAGRKSSESNGNEKTLKIATPQGSKLQFLRELQLIVPTDLPADERRIPLDLTGTSSQAVGYIHNEFSVRLGYALTNAAIFEGHLIELRRASKLLRANYMLHNQGDAKKYELDAAMMLSPDIKEIEDEIALEEAKLKILDGVIGGYTKIVEGASREISRRENENKRSGGMV